MKKEIIFLFIFLMVKISLAQNKDSLPAKNIQDTSGNKIDPKKFHVTYIKLDDGDTVPVFDLPPVDVIDALNPIVVDNMRKYLKLRRDVIRAYPYAKLAASTLKTMNETLEKIHKKKQRKEYIKASEQLLKARFEDELKKLTVNQGKILIKLIDRETGDTSYEIVKEMRGTFEAFFWQTMAKFFGSTLKSEYDPLGEDQVIESIVQAIERGEIPVAQKK